jgi:thiamine biosynthesis lipoprotein
MGMEIIVDLPGENKIEVVEKVFDYFLMIDEIFSPFKESSEVSKINQGLIFEQDYSVLMQEVVDKIAETKKQTSGYFNAWNNGKFDPSGLVKGWAIYNAGKIILDSGVNNFYLEAGGDIQTSGFNDKGERWSIGIKNPFEPTEMIKVVYLGGEGIATSGNYFLGEHIYSPAKEKASEIVSLTVVGQNIYEADRFATAAFAMGKAGIEFIEQQLGLEGYMIDNQGLATYTSNFNLYCQK